MKRLLLAGMLVLPLALSRPDARADQDDAYGSLLSMADSAANDRGPLAGEIPPDPAPVEDRRSAAAPSAGAAAARIAVERPERRTKRAPAPAAAREASRNGDAPSVAVPAAASIRVWTKVFSTLLPPARSIPAFEVAASTAPRGARPEPARPATPESDAGSAQGLLELVAAATAPSSPDR